MRELRVEDALLYLDQVKMEFGDTPAIYNEFLDIMKTFKTQQIDTPGVIRRVSNLFKGNRRLVLGFNTFLPEGYQIELPADGNGPPVAVYREPGTGIVHRLDGGDDTPQHLPYQNLPGAPGVALQQHHHQMGSMQVAPPNLHAQGPGMGMPPAAAVAEANRQKKPAARPPAARPPAPAPAPPAAPSPAAASGNQPYEFDHAINYVTTIKKRFSNQPEIYKRFLEILHTYQKEERGIKEVLNDVSTLFADHPDLLKQFTYFLPDAVQAQAKAQLDEVAKQAEMRQKNAKQNAREMHDKSIQQHSQKIIPRPAPPVEVDNNGNPIAFGATKGRSKEREEEIIKDAKYGTVSFTPKKPPRIVEPSPAKRAQTTGRPKTIPSRSYEMTAREEVFFQNVKEHLLRPEFESPNTQGEQDNGKNTPYKEFMKTLHLFGAGVLNKEELLMLVRSLFTKGHAGSGQVSAEIVDYGMELISNLESLMFNRGNFALQQERMKTKSEHGAMALHDVDYEEHKRVTPSYWQYPEDYPLVEFMKHSGQSMTDQNVLNNTLLCVNTEVPASPEDYNGIKARHNAYEEAMMKVEEERYEVDMAIELNAQAMRVIEPFAKEARMLREQEEADGQPIGRLQYRLKPGALKATHVNAIGRLYGDQGDEVIQHLEYNPLVVLPIVYERLKQKDSEWRKAKEELTKRWNIIDEANFEGTLDVLCYEKRRTVEHMFTKSILIDECKKAKSFTKHDAYAENELTSGFRPRFELSSSDNKALLFQPYLTVSACANRNEPHISHKHALHLVSAAARAHPSLSDSDAEKIGRIWAEFMTPWFGYDPYWVAEEVRSGMRYENSFVVRCIPGQPVMTIYGAGTILSSAQVGETYQYNVRLPFATAILNPSAILYSNEKKGSDSIFIRRDGVMVKEKVETYRSKKGLLTEKKLIFANEDTYVFMRLYMYLCSMLAEIESHCDAFEPPVDPSLSYHNPAKSGDRPPEKLDFGALLSSLKQVVAGKSEAKSFEALGRKISKERVHEIAALPRLVELCSLHLIKAARSGNVMSLFDFCRQTTIDPVAARLRCFTVDPEASYRIQYDSASSEISFMYLPMRRDLATTYQEPSEIDDYSDMEEGEIEAVEEVPDRAGEQDMNPREMKRQKTS